MVKFVGLLRTHLQSLGVGGLRCLIFLCGGLLLCQLHITRALGGELLQV